MKVKDILKDDTHLLDEIILDTLQKTKYPITQKEIMHKTGLRLSQSKFNKYLKGLEKNGYDIKKTIHKGTPRYNLVRYANLSIDDYYKYQGKVKTPLIHCSDFHIGSKGWSEQAYYKLLEDIDNYKIKHICHCGDILQGLGVYSAEAGDLSMFHIDEQVEACIDYLKMLPSRCDFHFITGNHESKLKERYKAGFDACSAIARSVNNANYYGHVAKLELNNEYDLLMLHGSGGNTYATSYKLEKLYDQLIEKANLVLTGHLHQFARTSRGKNTKMIQTASLQRESSWLMNKGITSIVGWNIVHDYDAETFTTTERTPRVY